MQKADLLKKVKTEGAKLKRTIINALPENDPQSQVTTAAVTQLFDELNALVQNANVNASN